MLTRLEGAADASLFFLGCLQHLLAGRCELVALLGEAGDDPAAARHDAFAVFLVIAHAGVALRGGQFLRKGLRRTQQGGCSQDGT